MKYQYHEPIVLPSGLLEVITVTVTKEWVRRTFFPTWKKHMIHKKHSVCLSLDNCIEDWKTIHWAYEI